MRALRINGMTFDLKEKAKDTAGVHPGCRGHCSSYMMQCRNGGRCVERYNGYSCDCSLTAYDGAFCTEGNAPPDLSTRAGGPSGGRHCWFLTLLLFAVFRRRWLF